MLLVQKAEDNENLMARILYVDLLASISETSPPDTSAECHATGERLQAVVDQGSELLARLPMEEALTLLNTVHRSASTSPLASILYLHMLLAATYNPERKSVESPLHSSRRGIIAIDNNDFPIQCISPRA